MNATALAPRQAQGMVAAVLPALARVLISLIFIQAVLGKLFGWSSQAEYMAKHGVSPVTPLLAAAAAIELLGVVCLLLGYQARPAALIMSGYLCIVSVLLHNFWSGSGSAMAQTEFLKNMGIIGGLLMVGAYGPGSWSLEAYLSRRSARG